jgi:RNA polymerase sigma-70 factor (ECF subfamily)
MQDDMIVSLYWKRDEAAISETEKKYGKYLFKIAYHVLSDLEDSKESVNDTYLKAWNSMPPHKPSVLSTYLGKITRQVSIDIFRKRNSVKRQASEYAVSLSELEECVSNGDVTEQSVDVHLLAESISRFLRTLSPEAGNIFVGRYYFMDSIQEIAGYYGMSQAKVKSMLHRTRIALKNHLEQEGFEV